MAAAGHVARPFERLSQLLRPERRDIGGIVLFALAVAVLSLATPIAAEGLVNTVAFGVLLWPILIIAAVLAGCLGLAATVRAMQIYVIECIQRRLFVRVVADYAQRLPRVQLKAFDATEGPELANRFFDVLTLQKSVATLLLDGIALIVTALVGMTVLAFYHPFLLGFDIVLLGAIAFITFALGWGGIRTSLDESSAKYEVAAWLESLARDTRPLKLYGGRHLATSHADELAAEYIRARKLHFRVVWRQTLFALALQVVASTTLLGLGGYLVISRQLTLGQLVAAELIVALVVASVAKLGKYAETYYDLLAAAEKLGVLTDLDLDRAGGEAAPITARGVALRVSGISPLGDWRLEPGEKVALSVPPGSGATTLLETLCGLREPADGYVVVDGIDLRELDLDSWRDQVAFVEGVEILAGSVTANVRVGRDSLSTADIRIALDTVGLLEIIQQLARGSETRLVPGGKPLSAVQARRLTLARAIAGQPRLLILDGVLDALNLHDCPALVPTLFSAAAPWTLIVISRDPDILDRCDRTITPVSTGPAELVLEPAPGATR